MAAPKLRFKEFDQKWGVDALQDQIDFLAGYAFDSKLMSNEPQKYQLIKMSNVYQNQLDLTRNPSYWTKIDSKIEKFLLKKGDIVLTLTGTVGKTDYGYNVEIDKDDKFLLNQRLVRLRAKQDLSDSKFIQYRISTDKFFYHFFYSSKGGTGNQSNVSIEDLKLLELSFPSKEEQTKIASFLSAVDEKISQLTQKHELLSQYKQGMMQKLFSQQIRFKADDGSEFGEWVQSKITDVADYVDYRGKTPKKVEDGILLVTAKNIRFGYIDYSVSQEYICSDDFDEVMRRGRAEIGDVLITTEAPLGNVASVDRENIALAQRVIKYRGKKGILNNEFLKQKFLSEEFQSLISSKATGGTVQGIKGSTLHNLEIHIPEDIEEQTKIANFLSSIDQKVDVVAQQIEQAKQWKKGLLQQMFV